MLSNKLLVYYNMQDTAMATQLATIILKRNKLMLKYQLSGNWDKYFVYIMDTGSRPPGTSLFSGHIYT